MNKKLKALLIFAILNAVVCFSCAGLRAVGLIKSLSIPTHSNTPTLAPGDCILVEGVTLLLGAPKQGKLVVFVADGIPGIPNTTTDGGETLYIKRLVGLPGDRLQVKAGKLFVNDVPALNQPGYTIVSASWPYTQPVNLTTEFVVPPGYAFMLGDNSANSLDSRYFGPVALKRITGVYLCHYWWSRDRGGKPKAR